MDLVPTLAGGDKGAFTGAARDEPGLIRAADRGTLFLFQELPTGAVGPTFRARRGA